jgi:C-terminal processing protease CtpA/Prc
MGRLVIYTFIIHTWALQQNLESISTHRPVKKGLIIDGRFNGRGLTAPDCRIYDAEGNWFVENEGVTPDIIVDLKPKEVAEGYDAQLMKGGGSVAEKNK